MKKTLFFIFVVISVSYFSQEYIIGKVVTEQNVDLPNVTVMNIRTGEKSITDQNGNFVISGKVGDYIRFVKPKYERFSYLIVSASFTTSLYIRMFRNPIEIQEVELKPKLTGNLEEDSKNVEQKKVTKLNKEISQYILQKSDPKILQPKDGEFVQPVGKGFSIGKINNQWDSIDLTLHIIKILGEDYFVNLGIQKIDIEPFIQFVLLDFDAKNSLKYGRITSSELLQFQILLEQKLNAFKKLKQS